MNRHGSIEKAERLLFNNWRLVLPVAILATVFYLVSMAFTLDYLEDSRVFVQVLFNFITFPVLYIGVTNFVVKLINGEKVGVLSLFEVLVKRPFQCYVFSFCYLSIVSFVLVFVNLMSFENPNLWNVIGILVNCFLTVKFVLAIYIFCQGYRDTALACLEYAWVRSKGYALELLKIYFTLVLLNMFLPIAGGIVASIIGALLEFFGVSLGIELVGVLGAIISSALLMFEIAAYSYLAVDSFGGSLEPYRFFGGVDRKGFEKIMVKVCLILALTAMVGFATVWTPSYVRYVKLDKSEYPNMYESLFDSGVYEYKAPKKAKSMFLAILMLDDYGNWNTVDSMELPISKAKRSGRLNVIFNNEDGLYEFNVDADGENYNKKGSDERLKFDFVDYVASSSVGKRAVDINEFEVLGKCYEDDSKDVKDDKLEDLMELDGVICTVVSFED